MPAGDPGGKMNISSQAIEMKSIFENAKRPTCSRHERRVIITSERQAKTG
jgi:hypothetical protein